MPVLIGSVIAFLILLLLIKLFRVLQKKAMAFKLTIDPEEVDKGGHVKVIVTASPQKPVNLMALDGVLYCKKFDGYKGSWLEKEDFPIISPGMVLSRIKFSYGENIQLTPGDENRHVGVLPIPEDAEHTEYRGAMQVHWFLKVKAHTGFGPPIVIDDELIVLRPEIYSGTRLAYEEEGETAGADFYDPCFDLEENRKNAAVNLVKQMNENQKNLDRESERLGNKFAGRQQAPASETSGFAAANPNPNPNPNPSGSLEPPPADVGASGFQPGTSGPITDFNELFGITSSGPPSQRRTVKIEPGNSGRPPAGHGETGEPGQAGNLLKVQYREPWSPNRPSEGAETGIMKEEVPDWDAQEYPEEQPEAVGFQSWNTPAAPTSDLPDGAPTSNLPEEDFDYSDIDYPEMESEEDRSDLLKVNYNEPWLPKADIEDLDTGVGEPGYPEEGYGDWKPSAPAREVQREDGVEGPKSGSLSYRESHWTPSRDNGNSPRRLLRKKSSAPDSEAKSKPLGQRLLRKRSNTGEKKSLRFRPAWKPTSSDEDATEETAFAQDQGFETREMTPGLPPTGVSNAEPESAPAFPEQSAVENMNVTPGLSPGGVTESAPQEETQSPFAGGVTKLRKIPSFTPGIKGQNVKSSPFGLKSFRKSEKSASSGVPKQPPKAFGTKRPSFTKPGAQGKNAGPSKSAGPSKLPTKFGTHKSPTGGSKSGGKGIPLPSMKLKGAPFKKKGS